MYESDFNTLNAGLGLKNLLRQRGEDRSFRARQANFADSLNNPAGAQSGLGMRMVNVNPGNDELVEALDVAQGGNGPAKGLPTMGGSFQAHNAPLMTGSNGIADNPLWWLKGMDAGGQTPEDMLAMLPQSMQALVKGRR